MAVWDLNRCIRHADILKRTYLCQVSDTGSPEPLVIICLYMYCSWRSSYQEGMVGIPLTGLNLPQFYTCHMLLYPFFSSHGHVSYCHHFLSDVRPSTFHILIFSSETTGPIATKLWWNGPWMAPFQNCVRWSRLQTKMATKLKIEKRGDAILIVHCCFSVSQNELKF
jgi:hypothetical protein